MKASPLRFPVPFSASSLALILLLTGCGSPEQDASNKLVNRGFEASSESFFEAVSVGDPAVLPLFREAGLSIDSLIDAEGNTGLILAAAAGKTEMVQALLDAGLDPRAVNTAGRTALIEASGKGFTDVARLLVGRGADLDAQDNEGWTALNLAAFNGQSDTVEFLAGKSEQESLDGALLVACFRGDTAVIDQLLNRGAYINARSPSGQTPLMIAAQGGHEDVIRLLLQNQANPFALDEEERTAAMLAEKGGYPVLRDLLLNPAKAFEAAGLTESGAAAALDPNDGKTASSLAPGDSPGDSAPVGTTPRPALASLDGATLSEKIVNPDAETADPTASESRPSAGAVSSLVLEGFHETPLPFVLKGVEGDSALIRLLSSTETDPVTVRLGETIPGSHYRIASVESKSISSKEGKGSLVDVSRVLIEDTDTGARHLLVKDVPGQSADTYATLSMPGSDYHYVVKDGDVFRALAPSGDEEDYRVLEIRPTQVVIQNVSSDEVLTIDRRGIAMR